MVTLAILHVRIARRDFNEISSGFADSYTWLGPAVAIPLLFIFRSNGENVTTDEAEAAAILSIATNKNHQDALPPISTFDLRDSLQVNAL